MTNPILQKLMKTQEQIEARIKSLKAKEAIQIRKDDTRKKILVGAYFLEKYEKNGTFMELLPELDLFLIRDNDRKLFGFPPKNQSSAATE